MQLPRFSPGDPKVGKGAQAGGAEGVGYQGSHGQVPGRRQRRLRAKRQMHHKNEVRISLGVEYMHGPYACLQ